MRFSRLAIQALAVLTTSPFRGKRPLVVYPIVQIPVALSLIIIVIYTTFPFDL